MDGKESRALFVQGKNAWNAWAAKMLAAREAIEAAGTWTADRPASEWNDATEAWCAEAEANFSRQKFPSVVDFAGFTFPGNAVFNEATFSKGASFGEATFSADARFEHATFSGPAGFTGATFSSVARFIGTTFSAEAWFDETTFSSPAWFLQTRFEGFTVFDDALFERAADFNSIEVKGGFSLSGATFLAVPNFIQAHFAEAPRLDHLHIRTRGFKPFTLARVKAYFRGDRNLSARWRALKRLALQGHDHVREHAFFKGELKSRRWCTDKPCHIAFWSGWAYQLLSDFGRSIIRPLLWWVASAVAFAPLYLGAHFDRAGNAFSAVGWTIDRFVLQPVGAAVASPLNCLAGWGDPWWAALGISARKSLLYLRAGFQRQTHPELCLPLWRHIGKAGAARAVAREFLPRRPQQRNRLRHRPTRHLRRSALPLSPGHPQPFPDQVRRLRGANFFSGSKLPLPPRPSSIHLATNPRHARLPQTRSDPQETPPR